MGLWSRIRLVFRMKAGAALDRAENPQQVLDYAYQQQQELVRKVKQGLVEVATSKHRLEQQAQKLGARVPQLEDQAKRALGANREDLARIAIERKQTALGALEGLQRQLSEVTAEEQRLSAAQLQLSGRVEEFRTRRDVMSARYSASEAQVKVSEALTGVSGEFAEISMAIGRAEAKTERMQARAIAIDSLIEGGALQLPGEGGGDLVDRELRALAVEDELSRVRAELGAAEPPPALEDQAREGSDDAS